MTRDEILVYNSGSRPRYRAVCHTEGWLVRLGWSAPNRFVHCDPDTSPYFREMKIRSIVYLF